MVIIKMGRTPARPNEKGAGSNMAECGDESSMRYKTSTRMASVEHSDCASQIRWSDGQT